MRTELVNRDAEIRRMWERVKRGVQLFERTDLYDGWFIAIDTSWPRINLLDPRNGILNRAGVVPGFLSARSLKITYQTEAILHGYFVAGWHGMSFEEEARVLRQLWRHAAKLRLEEYEEEMAWEKKREEMRERKEKLERKKRLQKIKHIVLNGLH